MVRDRVLTLCRAGAALKGCPMRQNHSDREMRMKKISSNSILIFVFLVGLSVLLYPSVSNYINSIHQSRAIMDYEEGLSDLTAEDYTEIFEKAEKYNEALRSLLYPLKYYDRIDGYEETLSVGGNPVMGYLTIDKIHVELPIYHGTSDSVLNAAVGHLEGTSLPIGGEGTHAVLSAHRGLPSAKLFSDLDKLEEGDTFTITVLDRVLTYEVDQIKIVEPSETEDLAITPGEDYCTLLTCTPYGVNTHRLLVRGTRTENPAEKPAVYVQTEAYRIDSLILTPLVAAPMLLILLIILLVKYRKQEKPEREDR